LVEHVGYENSEDGGADNVRPLHSSPVTEGDYERVQYQELKLKAHEQSVTEGRIPLLVLVHHRVVVGNFRRH
jgi:hypothetical protein